MPSRAATEPGPNGTPEEKPPKLKQSGSLADVEGMPVAPLDVPDTGPMRKYLAAQQGSETPSIHDFAEVLSTLVAQKSKGSGGGGDGGGGPPIDLKKFRKGNWMVNALIGAVVAASGAFAAYKATEARSIDNQEAIQKHADLPAHPQAQEEMRVIKARIGTIKNDISGDPATGQPGLKQDVKQIAQGVEQLKKEAQTEKQKRLEDKAEEQERKIRQLERELRRRGR